MGMSHPALRHLHRHDAVHQPDAGDEGVAAQYNLNELHFRKRFLVVFLTSKSAILKILLFLQKNYYGNTI